MGRSAKKEENLAVKLNTDKVGYPILPSIKETDGKGLLYKKWLIGKFMTDVYDA